MPISRNYPGICLEGLAKTKKKLLTHENQYFGRQKNQMTPEQTSSQKRFPSEPTCSAKFVPKLATESMFYL